MVDDIKIYGNYKKSTGLAQDQGTQWKAAAQTA